MKNFRKFDFPYQPNLSKIIPLRKKKEWERLLPELWRWGKFAKDKLAKRSCTNLCELKEVLQKIREMSYANLKTKFRKEPGFLNWIFANIKRW